MDVAEIVDQKSLEAWLNSLLQGTDAEKAEAQRWAVLIAHRAAMRVLPVFWQWTPGDPARRRDLTALPVLWANLIGGVAGPCPTLPIKAAARSALSATIAAITDSAARSAALSATRAADSADRSALSTALSAAADSVDSAARSALFAGGSALYAARSAAWHPVRTDCAALVAGRDPNRLPLWPAESPIADIWADTRAKALAQSPGWQFWVDWYDTTLAGGAQDWPLLTRIALIDPKDWEQGADHVNALIQRMIEQHDLWKEARRLKAENEHLAAKLRAIKNRGHNNPPELVDDLAPVAHGVTIIWAALDDAGRELEKQDPDPSVLTTIAQALLSATQAFGTYCLRLGDGVLQGAAKAAGTGLVGYGAYLASQNESVAAFAQMLLQFSRSLGH